MNKEDMKRHLVMDLFHGNQNTPVGEWHDLQKESPNSRSVKVLVEMSNQTQAFAYYYRDKRNDYHFWECKSHLPISEVVKWKYLVSESNKE